MGSPQVEELKHLIVQHVAKEHRDRALLLLNAIEQRRQNGPIGAPRGGGPVGSPQMVGALFRAPGAVPGFEDGQGLGAGWPEGATAGVRGAMPWGGAGGVGPDLNAAAPSSSWPVGFAGQWGGPGAQVPADGDMDSRMMELTLDGGPLNPVFGGGWGNPNPGFDLSANENGMHMAPKHPTSRLMGSFLLPPGSGEGDSSVESSPPPHARMQPEQQGKPSALPLQAAVKGVGAQPSHTQPSKVQPNKPPAAAPAAPPQTAAAAAAAPPSAPPAQKFSSVVGATSGSTNPGQQQRIAAEQRRQEAARAAAKAASKSSEPKRIDAGGSIGGKGAPPPTKGGMAQVKLRGLPYGATIQDVAAFFRGFGAQETSIQFGVNSDGRPSGEAWISFSRVEDARRAVREKDRNHMGDRYVELFLLNEGGGVASRFK